MTYFCKINKKVDDIFSTSDLLTVVLKNGGLKNTCFGKT